MCDSNHIEEKKGVAVLEHQEQKSRENERKAQEGKESGEKLSSSSKTMNASHLMALENERIELENQLNQQRSEGLIWHFFDHEHPRICEEVVYEDSDEIIVKSPERGYFDGKQ